MLETMEEINVISKSRPADPAMDFDLLRAEGIGHLESLATQIWTDFNAHDPGITMLEVLCYAITDLGYRTNLPLEDIMASGGRGETPFFYVPEILPSEPVTVMDFRKLLIDLPGIKNAWLSKGEESLYARKKLQMKVLRVEDIKSLLASPKWLGSIKTEAKDALSELSRLDSPKEQADKLNEFLTAKKDFTQYWDQFTHSLNRIWKSTEDVDLLKQEIRNSERLGPIVQKEILEFLASSEGSLPANFIEYMKNQSLAVKDLCVKLICQYAFTEILPEVPESEPEDYEKIDLNGLYNVYLELDDEIDPQDVKLREQIKASAAALLHAHRGLCEDFLPPKILGIEKWCLCLNLTLATGADEQDILAEVLFRLQNFLTPTLQFYTLPQLLEKGYTCDQVFNGPLLNHGFLLDEELAKAELSQHFYRSDLLRVILAIPEVLEVNEFSILQDGNNAYQEEWCIRIPEGTKPLIDPCCVNLYFQKGEIHGQVIGEKVLDRIKFLQLSHESVVGSAAQKVVVPIGIGRPDLAEYESIQYEFPRTYGIGNEGLPQNASPLRKAQSKQHQAYLLFFDQILAGYLAQLSQVKSLLSVNQDLKKPTYFFQALFEVPGMRNLIQDAQVFIISSDSLNSLKDLGWEDELIAKLARLEQMPFVGRKNFQEALESEIYLDQDSFSILLETVELPQNSWSITDKTTERLLQIGVGVDVINLLSPIKDQHFYTLPHFEERIGELLSPGHLQFRDISIREAETYALPNDLQWENYQKDGNNHYLQSLRQIVESPASWQVRKNHFLDHLLARFGEQFTDYVLTVFSTNKAPEDDPFLQPYDQYLQNKADFLRQIPSLAAERGKGYNYLAHTKDGQANIWNTENLAGLKKRVYAKMGWNPIRTESLTCQPDFIIDILKEESESGILRYKLQLKDKISGSVLMESPKASRRRKTLLQQREQAYLLASFADSYELKPSKENSEKFYLSLKNFREGTKKELLRSIPLAKSRVEQLRASILKLALPEGCEEEGFHLLEHILLRPRGPEQSMLALSTTCDYEEPILDPYSFWLTVILPGWTSRLAEEHQDFRLMLEQMIRKECPSHIALRFCWLEREEMTQFEPLYRRWRLEKSRLRPDDRAHNEALDELIDFINEQSCTCYCENEHDNPVLHCIDPRVEANLS